MRKLLSCALCILLLSCMLLPVSAQTKAYVVDEAELLMPEEIASLEQQAAALAENYGIDAVILIVDSLNGSRPQDYADDYYDQSGYGEDGVIFLLAMEEREWYISTCGSLIYALTDYGIQQLGEGAVSNFSNGTWYNGFYYYLTALPEYLDAYEGGAPMDGYADYSGNYYHGDQEEIVYYEEAFTPSLFFSLVCGLGAAGVTVLIMRLCMNTKRAQRGASAYLKEGSWNLSQHRDIFLYSNVTKTRRQQQSSGSGGGSSVHRSSGGRRHGGGGGKF